MIDWNEIETSIEDYSLISGIVDRAILFGVNREKLDMMMDLECAYNDTGLNLKVLLASKGSDFRYDISGILSNLNRTTGKIENYFVPRSYIG